MYGCLCVRLKPKQAAVHTRSANRTAGPETEALLRGLVSSVEEVQRSEGERGAGTEGESLYGADVRGQK